LVTPAKSSIVELAAQFSEIKTLSSNGIKEIVQAEKGSKAKSQHFVLQVIEVK
jgi:hypothetical protein